MMSRVRRGALILLMAALALGSLATLALADDGGLMQRIMGHDAFTAMVRQMRGVLGQERADQMIAGCEAMMATPSAASPQTPMGGMAGGAGMQGMMGRMMEGR